MQFFPRHLEHHGRLSTEIINMFKIVKLYKKKLRVDTSKTRLP